jgi:hypothetical protein
VTKCCVTAAVRTLHSQVRGLTRVTVKSEEEALAHFFQGEQVRGEDMCGSLVHIVHWLGTLCWVQREHSDQTSHWPHAR